jgi:hypothetical protein
MSALGIGRYRNGPFPSRITPFQINLGPDPFPSPQAHGLYVEPQGIDLGVKLNGFEPPFGSVQLFDQAAGFAEGNGELRKPARPFNRKHITRSVHYPRPSLSASVCSGGP